MAESRDEHWKRISAMAGLDEEGGILPLSCEGGINRDPNTWWKARDWAAVEAREGAKRGLWARLVRWMKDMHP